jgi:hypothetical protein
VDGTTCLKVFFIVVKCTSLLRENPYGVSHGSGVNPTGRKSRRHGSKKTILLVEDNEDDITLTLRAFEKQNLANKGT